jgi:ADP-heptose:LPS heptosyltransferase
MGALVLGYPMFQRLTEKFPDASLHILVFEKNREVVELLGIIPPENIIAINDRSLAVFARTALAALSQMRRLSLDAVIDCELFSRISTILSFLSGAATRVGFHPHTQEGLYRGNFMNRPVLYNPYQHISRQFLTLVDAIDSPTDPRAKRLPDRAPVSRRRPAADPRLAAGLLLQPGRRLAGARICGVRDRPGRG